MWASQGRHSPAIEAVDCSQEMEVKLHEVDGIRSSSSHLTGGQSFILPEMAHILFMSARSVVKITNKSSASFEIPRRSLSQSALHYQIINSATAYARCMPRRYRCHADLSDHDT